MSDLSDEEVYHAVGEIVRQYGLLNVTNVLEIS
jgi:hypothetical protein